MSRGRLQSLFQQSLDRALFGAYFIGAVLPLVVLGGIVHVFALPGLDGSAATTVIGAAVGAGLLSLAGFFAVRRLAARALERMDEDNAQLEQLLGTARALSRGAHTEEVAATAVTCALSLTGASAVFALLRDEKGQEPEALEALASAGVRADEVQASLRSELVDLAQVAIEDGVPSHLCIDTGMAAEAPAGASAALESSLARVTAVALPIPSNSARGAFVVARAGDGAGAFDVREVDALETLAGLAGVALDNADLQHTQRNFFAHVTELLVTALDAHVDRRYGHATAVAELANRVARELDLDDAAVRRVHFAALLHDIGMLKIEPRNQRDPAFFRKHSEIGARLLRRIKLWRDVAPIVLHHHEFYDGSGYPMGLVGDDIPIEARVILVCDAFDAMTRDDTHRRARPLPAALEELRRGMGTQFDPAVVRAFLELQQRGEIPIER